jgi:uncharacterized protein (TIGR01777 family)
MHILISGASGLIGRELASVLLASGHSVSRLVRGRPLAETDVPWRPSVELNPETLKDVDVVVNLAGRSVAGRWNDRVKNEIRESRIPSTAALARSIAASHQQFGRPTTFVSASAVGYYGSRGDDILTEASSLGNGFLPQVSRDWEAATAAASEAGVRVVMPRIAVVLSENGGALSKMLPIFKLGLGGRIGSGHQWFSWISLDDLVAFLVFAITNQSVSGPVNASAPTPVTNAKFTRTLAAQLHRPAIFPLPASVARLMFSREGADEMLLSSQRVVPKKLEELGFQFRDRDLESALARILAGQ